MRKFVDLHLCPTFEEIMLKRVFNRSAELGYELVGVSLPINVTKNRIRKLRKICYEKGLDLATRLDIRPNSIYDLTSILGRIRNRFEIISVDCVSKPVSRQAAKDRRVDLISTLSDFQEGFFDSTTARLASENLSAFEVNMAPLLYTKGIRRARIIYKIRRNVKIALKSNLEIVISSGSANEYLLRNPRDYAALSTLFDLTSQQSLRAISEVPLDLVQRNREKLKQDYIAPGIVRKNGIENA